MPGQLRSLAPGFLIGDKYEVVQVIGAGGMGIVYEARHARLGQRVAVKTLLPELMQHADAITRFEREARAAAHLRSRHVAKVFDVDALADGTPYIVMELLEGRDLADELSARGSLPAQEAVDYIMQACDAMAEAHRVGIVHRDLKPSNMFLAREGRRSSIKVLDFGISKVLDEAVLSVTTTRSGLGTASYMSPEQVRSAKHVDARSDVWALGVVLYEMLTGAQPFPGDTATAVAAAIVADRPVPLRSRREDILPALEQVLMRALEKDRDLRFADAAAFGAALAPFAPSHSSRRGMSSTPPRDSKIDPTLHSPVDINVPVRPRRGSPSDEAPASGVQPKWSHPRNLWIPVGLLIGLFAAAAFFRELARESPIPSSSASSNASVQVLAPPPAPTELAPETIAPSVAAPAVAAPAVAAPAVAAPSIENVPVAKPPASTGPSKPAARAAAPASIPHPAATKEPSAAPSSTRSGNVQKGSHGLPPDPG